jgi:hypothetical protein
MQKKKDNDAYTDFIWMTSAPVNRYYKDFFARGSDGTYKSFESHS